MKSSNYRILIVLVLLSFSCKKGATDSDVPSGYSPTPHEISYPDYFPELTIPIDNPLTVEGINLGRRLYYDPLLSTGGPLNGASCSNCHFQEKGFCNNTSGTSVLAHVNLGWNSKFLWTGKVEGELEDIMKFEVEDFFKVDVGVLQSDPIYPDLFYKAYGSKEITEKEVAYALAQFFRVLASTDSKLDKFLRKEVALSPSELNGMDIFFTEKGDCFHCHTVPLMTNNDYHNIGLDSVFSGGNLGRYTITTDVTDIGKFKSPSLRNVALTAPYMHDGRFATLEEVVEHYNSGVKNSSTLDPLMTKPGKEFGLQLTAQEKSDLVSFLKTFTDDTFLTDTTLSNPF